jgi:hypothetical protein
LVNVKKPLPRKARNIDRCASQDTLSQRTGTMAYM